MEQTQPKLSKYAAKQALLATDPTFGTDYSDHFDKINDQIAAGIDAATARREAMTKAEQQDTLDKIIKLQAEIRILERRIKNAKAHIVKLTAAIERRKELLLQ